MGGARMVCFGLVEGGIPMESRRPGETVLVEVELSPTLLVFSLGGDALETGFGAPLRRRAAE